MKFILQTNGEEVSANIRMPRKMVALVWTGVTLLFSGGGYHVVDTRARLALCKEVEEKQEKRIHELEEKAYALPLMPGPSERKGHVGAPLIAPDTTRRLGPDEK